MSGIGSVDRITSPLNARTQGRSSPRQAGTNTAGFSGHMTTSGMGGGQGPFPGSMGMMARDAASITAWSAADAVLDVTPERPRARSVTDATISHIISSQYAYKANARIAQARDTLRGVRLDVRA